MFILHFSLRLPIWASPGLPQERLSTHPQLLSFTAFAPYNLIPSRKGKSPSIQRPPNDACPTAARHRAPIGTHPTDPPPTPLKPDLCSVYAAKNSSSDPIGLASNPIQHDPPARPGQSRRSLCVRPRSRRWTVPNRCQFRCIRRRRPIRQIKIASFRPRKISQTASSAVRSRGLFTSIRSTFIVLLPFQAKI